MELGGFIPGFSLCSQGFEIKDGIGGGKTVQPAEKNQTASANNFRKPYFARV